MVFVKKTGMSCLGLIGSTIAFLVLSSAASMLRNEGIGMEAREVSENEDSGIIWASSGGGWRAQAASIGFSNLFGRAGLLPTAGSGQGGSSANKIESISTNSGASWFSAQFFYSENFYERVMTIDDGDGEESAATMRNLVYEWMTKYEEYQQIVANKNSDTDDYIDIASWDPTEYTEFLKLLMNLDIDWGTFITGMLDYVAKNVYNDNEFASVLATPNNRIAPLQETAQLIHSSLVPQTSLNSKLNSLGPSSKEGFKYSGVLPVTYSVGNDGAEYRIAGNHDKDDPLQVYQSDQEYFYEWKDYKEYGIYPNRPETLIPADGTNVGVFNTDFFGGNTKATQAASISSAEKGGFSSSNPSLFTQVTSWEYNNLDEIEKKPFYAATVGGFESGEATGVSVPTQWPNQGNELDGRFVDGGFSDNTALAQTIAYYQARPNADLNKVLRIILSNNDTNSKKELNPDNAEVVKFFANDENKGIPPGESFWCECQENPHASAQIFSETVTLEQFKAQTKPVGQFLTNRLSGKTITNPLWGIKGGQKVEILVIATDVDIPTTVIGSGEVNKYIEPLMNLATDLATNSALLELVKEFVSEYDNDAAVKVPGELASYAVSEGPKAVSKFSSA
jgi:hypothetical protein